MLAGFVQGIERIFCNAVCKVSFDVLPMICSESRELVVLLFLLDAAEKLLSLTSDAPDDLG